MKEKKQLIRNSTAEFLTFTGQAGGKSIVVRYENDKKNLVPSLLL
jgi:hypothetical protein